jgi:protein-disulfide isomerase
MKIYFLAIPVIIGILFGVLFTITPEEPSNDSTILNKENLLVGSTILGNPDAKITVVEFGDYQCTFCYKFHNDVMKKINEKYIKSGDVNFVYKDFPLNGKPSLLASEASYCAQQQDRFWTYHDMLYDNWGGENTGWITQEILSDFAKESELNLEKFNSCMENSEFRQKVLNNEQFAKGININATPSFLIFNDNEVYRIVGAQPFEQFEITFQKLRTSG